MALVGNELLYVQGISANGMVSGQTFPTTTGAIAALAAATVLPPVVNTAITTSVGGTITAAGIVGGLITRSGPTAAFSDATDTALAIVAALAAYVANESAYLTIKNTTAFFETITAGAGVTLTGSVIIPPFSSSRYLVTINSATAVTLLHIETVNLPTTILKCTTAVAPATTALIDVTGLTGQALVAGATYKFRAVLPGLADGTSGQKYAFTYTTATLTSIEATGIGYTASAVAVQHTTTTTNSTLLFDQAAAVVMVILEGTMVVNAGGTVNLQTGLHTGTTAGATYVGATMEFTRIA